jgi:hypothetical protein
MKPRISPLDDAAIDAFYGLEPVIDPARESSAVEPDSYAAQFIRIQCPYCGEPFETLIEPFAGTTRYIEDCHVCCRPIEIGLEVAMDGALASVTAQRTD